VARNDPAPVYTCDICGRTETAQKIEQEKGPTPVYIRPSGWGTLNLLIQPLTGGGDRLRTRVDFCSETCATTAFNTAMTDAYSH
jgi:hypothetical protein